MSEDPQVMDELAILRRGLLAALPALLGVAAPAEAQNAAAIQPMSYRVVLENERVRVMEYRSRPGMGVCGVGRHSHPAHVTIPLTPGKVRVTIDGKVVTLDSGIGDAFWEPAVTHEVENVSGHEMRALLVEIKDPPCRR